MVRKYVNQITGELANIYVSDDGSATLIITSGDNLILNKEYSSESIALRTMNRLSSAWCSRAMTYDERDALCDNLYRYVLRKYHARENTLNSVFDVVVKKLRSFGYEVHITDTAHRDSKTLTADGRDITIFRRIGWDYYCIR